jgi:hypothetical protein
LTTAAATACASAINLASASALSPASTSALAAATAVRRILSALASASTNVFVAACAFAFAFASSFTLASIAIWFGSAGKALVFAFPEPLLRPFNAAPTAAGGAPDLVGEASPDGPDGCSASAGARAGALLVWRLAAMALASSSASRAASATCLSSSALAVAASACCI